MMHTETKAIEVIGSNAGETVCVLGAPIVIKSGGRRDQLFFADHPVPPGYGVPMHVHAAEDELFYILEGEITLDSAEGTIIARPGAFVHLPRGVAHGFRNAGATAARMLVVTTPGGCLEGVFRDLDASSREQAEMAPASVAAICARHNVAMV
jgi:quercetin dioxygenase-like cupin family protein